MERYGCRILGAGWPPVTAEQHLIDTFAAANEFVSTLADRLYRTIMPVTELSLIHI